MVISQSEARVSTENGKMHDISPGRTQRCRYLDHAFMPHCTVFPHLRAQRGAIGHHWNRAQYQMHFCATLLILLLEIRFNFQIDMQYAEKGISKITFNIWWNLEQILTFVTHCGWTTSHGKCPMYDHDALRIWICDALFTECYTLCTNAPSHLRSEACL